MSEGSNGRQARGSSGISRRDALKRGAVIGGAAFVVPAVQSISMSRAAAQTPSGGGGGGITPGSDHHHHHHHWWDS
jgi:hypothetical protein